MTLIEFNEAAKAIIAKAGWEGCQFSTTAETQNYAGSTTCNFNYRIAAHPQGVMLTSYDTGFDYFCNNPTLALERFQSAVDRRLAPPSEPEAITEIEAPEEVVGIYVTQEQLDGMKTVVSKNAPQPESEVGNG